MITDEDSDEVKVFRRDADAEADDDPMIGAESSAEVDQQLAEDKKAAVMEAESEGAAASGIEPGASSSGRAGMPSLNGLKTESYVKQESPSFPHLIPGLMPGAFSPNYAALPLVMPFIMHNAYVRSPMFPMSAALSPSFPLMTSPYFQSMTAAAAKHQLENANPLQMRVGPLNQLNQMRMNPYMAGPGMMMPNGVDPHHHHQRRTNGGGKVKKEDHIKKPLNAFMWYMKENRKKLIDEIGPEKQSAELNKELGKRWHGLPKNEQAKYFELAKKDRESHKEKYPQWSARENYAVHKKKTKKRRDKSIASENSELKKCRARFGVNNTDLWCKFCKRKKKCEYATDRSGGDMADAQDGRGTSGACSDESSESPSPPGAAAIASASTSTTLPMQLPPQMLAGIPQGLPPQQQQALMHQMIMQMQHLGSSSSLGPSPMASSSAGRSPPEDADASDSESDVDEDEEIDPTITQLTTDTMMQDSLCI